MKITEKIVQKSGDASSQQTERNSLVKYWNGRPVIALDEVAIGIGLVAAVSLLYKNNDAVVSLLFPNPNSPQYPLRFPITNPIKLPDECPNPDWVVAHLKDASSAIQAVSVVNEGSYNLGGAIVTQVGDNYLLWSNICEVYVTSCRVAAEAAKALSKVSHDGVELLYKEVSDALRQEQVYLEDCVRNSPLINYEQTKALASSEISGQINDVTNTIISPDTLLLMLQEMPKLFFSSQLHRSRELEPAFHTALEGFGKLTYNYMGLMKSVSTWAKFSSVSQRCFEASGLSFCRDDNKILSCGRVVGELGAALVYRCYKEIGTISKNIFQWNLPSRYLSSPIDI